MKRFALLALASGMAIAAASPANAAIIFAFGVNGGATTTLTGTTTGSITSFNGGANNYSINLSATGAAGLPDLRTVALTVADNGQSGAGTINLYVTKTDVNPFTSGLLSTFNSNTLTGSAADVRISSFYSTAEALFGGTLLQTNLFNGLGTFSGANAIVASGPAGSWSETVRYDIRFTGGEGTFNGTANLAAVPEPATWGMMIMGFGLMGGVLRRRSTKVAFA